MRCFVANGVSAQQFLFCKTSIVVAEMRAERDKECVLTGVSVIICCDNTAINNEVEHCFPYDRASARSKH